VKQPTYSDPINLEEPIKRGETTIASITMRKPASGELRGLKLLDLLNGDVNATIRLVPRISTPTLTEQEVAALEPADLLSCADAIAAFLQKKGEQTEPDSPTA
jgi:CxxC motif-containing protein (DUF1111 family)